LKPISKEEEKEEAKGGKKRREEKRREEKRREEKRREEKGGRKRKKEFRVDSETEMEILGQQAVGGDCGAIGALWVILGTLSSPLASQLDSGKQP
jgi:hypothetical protein